MVQVRVETPSTVHVAAVVSSHLPNLCFPSSHFLTPPPQAVRAKETNNVRVVNNFFINLLQYKLRSLSWVLFRPQN